MTILNHLIRNFGITLAGLLVFVGLAQLAMSVDAYSAAQDRRMALIEARLDRANGLNESLRKVEVALPEQVLLPPRRP